MADKALCTIPDCCKPVAGQGFCTKHYHYRRRHGLITVRARHAGEGPTCSVDGCALPRLALGLCQTHYTRSRRKSDKPFTPRGSARAFFFDMLEEFPATDECVLWPFALRHGYGVVNIGTGITLVTRAICEKVYGPAPPDHHACHSCDNPPCWNPRHLRWGSPTENAMDAVIRRRRPLGEECARSKLTDELVREILTSTESGNSLSRRLGVDKARISRIRTRKAWTHIKLLRDKAN